MEEWQGLAYSVDIVLVINATGSMARVMERVKASALSLPDDLAKAMSAFHINVDLRVRVVVFRDFYAVPLAEALMLSDFFRLPEQRGSFADFLRGIRAIGGDGNAPGTGLAALAEAIRSPWADAGSKQRQVIVVWTNSVARYLEKNEGDESARIPAYMPAGFDELTDLWEGPGSPISQPYKRLLLFAPGGHPWSDMSDNWECTLHYASEAGLGLGAKDYESILDALFRSV